MKTILIAAFVALIAGFGIAWNWQAQRWDADVAKIRKDYADATEKSRKEQDSRIEAAENQKENIQNAFDTFRRAEDERNASLDRGVQRVYVRAKCPTVPAASTDSSGAKDGTAELDPAYRSTLSALRNGAAEQLRLLNICRVELEAR
ncbi:Rz-like lysis protein [Myoviridae environmental samples]|nr:Rz-like lysis protein [Myoviridae environmental samples]